MFCKCGGKRKDYPLTGWRIIRLKYTPHRWSRLYCRNCKCSWVTGAAYVEQTPEQHGQTNLFKYDEFNG